VSDAAADIHFQVRQHPFAGTAVWYVLAEKSLAFVG
jgi:hypothetical protein